MKKVKLFVMLFVLSLLMPINASAQSLSLSVNCSTIIVGQTGTCTISGTSDVNISAIKGNIELTGNGSLESTLIPIGFTPLENTSSSFSFLANSNMTGNFQIAKFNVKGNAVGTATFRISNIIAVDKSDYSEFRVDSKSVSISIVSPPTTTTTTTTRPPVTSPSTTTRKPVNPSTPITNPNDRPDVTTPVLQPLRLTSITVDNFNVVYENGAYYVTTDSYTEKVTINATADEGVSIIGTGIRALAPGKNTVELVLRNESGQTNTYLVIITRPDDLYGHDTKLSNLRVVNYNLPFNPNVTEYTLKVPYNTKEIYVIAESLNSDVTVSGAGLKTLSKGKNKIYVKVSYGENLSTTYVITVKKSYGFMFMLIGLIGLGGGMIGAIIYGLNLKKKVANNVATNKVVAKENREKSVGTSVSFNGQKIVGNGFKTVVPTKVISVKPAQNMPTDVPTRAVVKDDNISESAPSSQVVIRDSGNIVTPIPVVKEELENNE